MRDTLLALSLTLATALALSAPGPSHGLSRLAGQELTPASEASVDASDTSRRSPRPNRAISPQLRAARNLAVSRLRHGDRCRGLFEAEGADGLVLLERATFRAATKAEYSEICRRRRAALFTTVYGKVIAVCAREFAKLKVNHRAAILLHEVLHHAGVSEQPNDPLALSPTQLTRKVERHCSL